MRKILDNLYLGTAILGAVFFTGTAGFILFQIGGGLFGYVARSSDDFAGWCMAASAFLALAHTLNANEHIRVTLLVQNLPARARRGFELASHAVGTAIAAYFAWFSVRMVWISWQLAEMSQTLVPVPMWIPQSAMGLGAAVLAVAMADRLAGLASGRIAIGAETHSVGADR